MKAIPTSLLLFVLTVMASAQEKQWITDHHTHFELRYQLIDQNNKATYLGIADSAYAAVELFFGTPFQKPFQIFIYPNRASLDEQWRKDWNMPDFRSECWMVASGIASKVDMISPRAWKTEACEHRFEDRVKTRELITHEFVHVFHGQFNESPDFSDVSGLDWFVEGLATFASGQCDAARIAQVKTALEEGKVPSSLDAFWTGKFKYGLSGSVVMFIDHHWGRSKLKELLVFNKKEDVLKSLGTTEADLLANWKKYMATK